MNAIDRCWRENPNWRRNRQQLARCAVGYSGKMSNIRRGIVRYKVTDPSDNPVKPKPGTLRYGATMIKGKVWITFQRDMHIRLEKPLLNSSFTTIDGNGVSVSIAGNACLRVFKANNVIIHGLRIHHCRAQLASLVMGPHGRIVNIGQVWIDHNTLYQCQDGILDVTRGSTDITVSNNWFRDQDKVMLLGHSDGYLRDKNIKVTVVYNHFGPNCNQMMPSMNPSIKSEANLFVMTKSGKKELTWRSDIVRNKKSWRFYSPNYNHQQSFHVVDAQFVRSLTRSAGVLQCT
ncbi:hypothetical protein UlMin_020657 [Ulmus minor]